ncbi:MAG: hypothetical protein NWQ23_04120 [Yoonia sp.]|uniref:hypothetical protein n=1 Tax=Yoonia sp. TaxID=2212373 RepID=UPI00273F8421|nr:hypothetical protein [Yoonia sp.]MDP5084585.1 hypothetical protein [Yoonia sp.]
MKSWLTYSFAFACGLGAWTLLYMAAFTAAMSGAVRGIASFVVWVQVGPVLGAFVVFALVFGAITMKRPSLKEWLYALAFVAAATFACCGLLIAGLLDEIFAAVLLLVTLFFGGRYLEQRRTHA